MIRFFDHRGWEFDYRGYQVTIFQPSDDHPYHYVKMVHREVNTLHTFSCYKKPANSRPEPYFTSLAESFIDDYLDHEQKDYVEYKDYRIKLRYSNNKGQFGARVFTKGISLGGAYAKGELVSYVEGYTAEDALQVAKAEADAHASQIAKAKTT